MIGSVRMKQLTLESNEFKKIVSNLQLENLSLSDQSQKKILNIINNNMEITSTLIKELLRNDKV